MENKEITIKANFSALGEIQKSFSPEQIKFIMDTVAPGLNEKEVWLFLLKANVLKLNPLLGEIFAYSYTDRVTGQRKLVIIEGRNGKRNLASKSGKVEYIKTQAIYVKDVQLEKKEGQDNPQTITIIADPWDGKLWGAKSEVKIVGRQEPFIETVKLTEYNTGKNVWLSKPETMIKKVAESQALSAALPELMLDLVGEAENFVEPSKETPEISSNGGDEEATDGMLATLKVLGANMDLKYTKLTATNEIKRITQEKSKKAKETVKKDVEDTQETIH